MTTTDQATLVRRAPQDARRTFDGDASAGRALNYFERLLAAAPAGGGNASIAEGSLTGAGVAPVVVLGGWQTLDAQVMEAMNAEVARLAGLRTESAAVAPAAAAMLPLSEEVTFLARQLRQPPELVAQLLVLAELRSLRAEWAGQALATASVLS